MGRAPCCDEEGIKKGPWTPEEDQKLVDYIQSHGHGSWRALPKLAGLKRCGKSCRLRWTNYLRPDIKRGKFTDEEEQIIIKLHSHLGNKWSAIAARLPGRTDNEIKNYWNTHLKKKLLQMGIDPVTHKPRTDLNLFGSLAHLLASSNFLNLMNPLDSALVLQANAAQLERIQLLQNILRSTMTGTIPQNLEAFNLMGLPLLQDYHFNDLSRLNCQLDGLLNGSLGVVQNPTPIQSNLSNSGIQQPTYDYPALEESCVRFDGQQRLADSDGFGMKINNNNDNQMTLSCSISPTMPATTLVPSTPEFVDVDKLRNQVNPSEISNNSSTSTPFDVWGELNLEDQASDYCLNIINQPTSPSWPNEY